MRLPVGWWAGAWSGLCWSGLAGGPPQHAVFVLGVLGCCWGCSMLILDYGVVWVLWGGPMLILYAQGGGVNVGGSSHAVVLYRLPALG